MKDEAKIKKQLILINELLEMRQRIAVLKASGRKRKRAEEEEILRRDREMTALHRALLSITPSLSLEEVLYEIVSQTGATLGSTDTSIVLVSERPEYNVVPFSPETMLVSVSMHWRIKVITGT